MKFGDHLKNARTELNLTQEQVANDFLITRQTISSWENEKTYPDIASLIKLSDYYHISLDVLLKEDTGMKEYLNKKEIYRSIKPSIIMLLIIDFIFILLVVLKWLDIFKINHEAFLAIIILGLLNATALILLGSFQNKLVSKKKHFIFTTRSFIITTTILSILLLISLFTLQNEFISGLLSSGVFVSILLYLVKKFTSI
jgi:transcriptional regulator with XRE-family HTH domain